MESDEIRRALLRWDRRSTGPTWRRWLPGLFRSRHAPVQLMDGCVRVSTEIVAKACAKIGREFKFPPGVELPDDYHVIIAFCFMISVTTAASLEDDSDLEDMELIYRTSKYLFGGRSANEVIHVVEEAWELSQRIFNESEGAVQSWQRMLVIGIDGYILGKDILDVVPGGYPQLFGDLLSALIESQKKRPQPEFVG